MVITAFLEKTIVCPRCLGTMNLAKTMPVKVKQDFNSGVGNLESFPLCLDERLMAIR